jgi:hypothetical protein
MKKVTVALILIRETRACISANQHKMSFNYILFSTLLNKHRFSAIFLSKSECGDVCLYSTMLGVYFAPLGSASTPLFIAPSLRPPPPNSWRSERGGEVWGAWSN